MTDHAINIILVAKVEGFILPAITGMALGAHALIATRVSAESVDQVFFAQQLTGFFVLVSPGSVYVFHELMTGFGMALQAGFRHLGAAGEGDFQIFKFRVVGSGIGVGTLSRLFHNFIQAEIHIGICFLDCLSSFSRSLWNG